MLPYYKQMLPDSIDRPQKKGINSKIENIF